MLRIIPRMLASLNLLRLRIPVMLRIIPRMLVSLNLLEELIKRKSLLIPGLYQMRIKMIRMSLWKLLKMMMLKSGNQKMENLQTKMMMLKSGKMMKVSLLKTMPKSGKMIMIIQKKKNQNQLKIN